MKENSTSKRRPINIQTFAAPAELPKQNQHPTQIQTPPAGQPTAQRIDYSKIQQMLDGTLAAKEDTALKAYFKQQGLNPREMEYAIAGFKQQKAISQPDVGALQTQLVQAQQVAIQSKLESQVILKALSLGVDIKTVPYLLKLVDSSSVMEKDGQINDETLTAAVNKVLEDVPVLKPQAQVDENFRVGAGDCRQRTADSKRCRNSVDMKVNVTITLCGDKIKRLEQASQKAFEKMVEAMLTAIVADSLG